MTTDRRTIDVGGISVEIVRKEIKNLHVGVYPPHGRVRVAAPKRLGDEAVRLAIISRLGWIRRQQAQFAQQDRQSEREMVTGESHFFRGRRYRLDVIEREARPTVRLKNNATIEMGVRPGTDATGREVILQQWYREWLRQQIPRLIAKWEPKVGVRGVEVRIKKMKTRWGSCNAAEKRIWLNSELAKKPIGCTEYILVHEMVHLIERHHNERFRELMDRLMPTWRQHRQQLNAAPLGHEEWRY